MPDVWGNKRGNTCSHERWDKHIPLPILSRRTEEEEIICTMIYVGMMEIATIVNIMMNVQCTLKSKQPVPKEKGSIRRAV
jgi:hypothetical protein